MSNSTVVPAETYLASAAFAESFKKVDFNTFLSVYNDTVQRTRYLQDLEEELMGEANRLSREEFLHDFNSFITKGSNHFHAEAREQLRFAADDLATWPQPHTYADVLKEPKDPWNCTTFDDHRHTATIGGHTLMAMNYAYTIGKEITLFQWIGKISPDGRKGNRNFGAAIGRRKLKKRKGRYGI
ncbi:hypothetical protein K435DRAFT_804135 [Dendrothele bispora CBS 962.96]|uniref:Uncharacterized protein n=1 Tax=Dendrothele bispora (strain CBS 962.96) TaxID=1314807 RepID=A0A4S8LF75_DENBC|nr:hypothetical protein K435DRAFT_804135 [Dendrothele bispora CBS 962.96]